MTVQEIGDEFTTLSHQYGLAQKEVRCIVGVGEEYEIKDVVNVGDYILLTDKEIRTDNNVKRCLREESGESKREEKLEQEVKEFLDKNLCCAFKDECKAGIRLRCSEYETRMYLLLRFAEPRETDLKANFDYVLEGKDLEIKQLGERCNQLLKDKGDLTDELAKWKDEWQEQVQKATDEGYARTLQTIQLTKAKELIENIIRVTWGEGWNYSLDWKVKAEQFLKGENIILEDAQVGNSPFDADEVFNKEMKAYPEEK